MNLVFQCMNSIALKEKDFTKSCFIITKQIELAKLFEMGKHQEALYGLELALMMKRLMAICNPMSGGKISQKSSIRFESNESAIHDTISYANK